MLKKKKIENFGGYVYLNARFALEWKSANR